MIDLRSDTVTRPTEEMRTAAAEAEVGDDVYGEDPSVNELETTAASLVGKEAAMYVPSGTMGNQTAALAQTEQATSMVVEAQSHIYGWECAGLAVHGGLQPVPIDGGPDGLYGSEELEAAIVQPESHRAATGLIAVENTHNRAGGIAHPPDALGALADVAAEHEIPFHLDGARLFNAAVALDVDPAELAAPADTVMFCLSKGLGAPVGSMLAGPESVIEDARRARRLLGGGMRQAGIIAAPGLVALSEWQRLEEDHLRAARLAREIGGIGDLITSDPETNIVIVDVSRTRYDAEDFVSALADEGVRALSFGPERVRLCTHRDLDDDDIASAVERIRSAVA